MDTRNFRLKLSQFLFASFKWVGFKLVKSKDLDKIISEGSIIHLCRQAGKRDQQTFIHAFLPDEKLFAISCITPAQDSSGRTTSHNRTLLFRTTDLEEALKPLLTEQPPLTPPKQLGEICVKVEVEC